MEEKGVVTFKKGYWVGRTLGEGVGRGRRERRSRREGRGMLILVGGWGVANIEAASK